MGDRFQSQADPLFVSAPKRCHQTLRHGFSTTAGRIAEILIVLLDFPVWNQQTEFEIVFQ